MEKHKYYNVWSRVPINYYQRGVKKNFLQNLWHTRKINLTKKILEKIKFDNCLDVGCASGFMVAEIAKTFTGPKYYGVDVYDKAINYAKKTYKKIDFKVASADKLPFKDKSLDLVIFCETIEHVEDPYKCLIEIKRVLKEKGTLIVTMDSGSLLFRIVWFFWERTTGKVWKKAHLHPFHHRDLEKLIIKAGFKIKKKYFSFLGMEVTFII